MPSLVVCVSASVNLPLHHKVQKFSSGTGSPGWSRQKGHKTVVVCDVHFSECLLGDPKSAGSSFVHFLPMLHQRTSSISGSCFCTCPMSPNHVRALQEIKCIDLSHAESSSGHIFSSYITGLLRESAVAAFTLAG